MAAPPSTANPASWKPAVPPPPVTGAAVGIGLDDGLGVGLGEGVALALADGAGVPDELSLALALELADAPPLALLLALADPLALGGNTVTDELELGLPEDVQAESATQASMVVRPQPKAVRRIRCAVHAMAVRALIKPPRVLRNDHFPIADGRNEENAGDLNGDKPAMACPASEY
jgi:hypothetical protein